MDKVNMAENKNRRGFFRIYDEVNLFYQKLDEQSATAFNLDFDNPLASPAHYSDFDAIPQDYPLRLSRLEKNQPDRMTANGLLKGHETIDVNISASGMAFMSDEELKEGDDLIFSIQLVSAKTAIVTRGKIVYCRKDTSDDDQCPFFVGAHFVDMQDKDREVLSMHVDKKHRRQKWVNGIILAAVITVLVAPGGVFDVLSGLLHFLFVHVIELCHIAFELIESGLDHLIEHLFHTDLHKTQVIVFYILLSFVFYGLYLLWRVVPPFFRRCKKNQSVYWARKKVGLFYYWRELSAFDKVKLAVIGVAAITLYILFGF